MYSNDWFFSNAKSDVLSCNNALVGQNVAYPDRSNKNPNPDKWRYPDSGCRQGIGWCGVSSSNAVGQNSYQDPPGGTEYHKITHWLWPDTFQRHCVLKPELKE
jgi:hypothetical protein